MTSEPRLLPRVMSLAVHELRTPVTVVSGYLRMLLREQGGPLSEKQRKMVEEAERSCSRIAALVTEMSELGKLEGGDLSMSVQEFDLAPVLTEVASGMHEGDDRGVRVELRGANQPLAVSGDRTRLSAALTSLLHAAVREQGEPGAVVVDCSIVTNDRRWLVIAIGVPPLISALRDHADPSRMFDEWIGGLGMALPVARRIVEAHGGSLWSVDGTTSRAASALRIPLRA